VAEVREDLAHDDWVCELRYEAAWAAAMRAGEDVDGEGDGGAGDVPAESLESSEVVAFDQDLGARRC